MKKHLTRLLAGLLAAGALVLPARAVSSNYKHTYHTQVVGRAEITLQVRSEAGELLSEETKTVEYESEFVEGNVSDEGPTAELAVYEAKVAAAIGDAKILDHQTETALYFDHFESQNVFDENGSVNKYLDVHEYQIYTQTDTYRIEKTQAAITPPTNPEPPADSEPPVDPEPSADPEPPTSSEPGASEPLPDDAPQTSEPAAQPDPTEEAKGISLWWILPAALVLCAGLGAGGYFLWKKKKSN